MSLSKSAGQVQSAPRRGIFGWMMFDWAAQPFFTVVITFIFGPYFVSQLAANPDMGQAWWGYAVAISGFIIAIMSPVLGSIADAVGPRKPWIAAFAVIKIGALFSLWLAAPGSSLFYPALMIVLASVSAEFSIVFNDSMMPRLVAPKDVGRISNIAWGLGYLGGMIMLIFVVGFMAGNEETGKTLLGMDPVFGLDPGASEAARATGPLSALWYLIFILPMFFFTPDYARPTFVGSAVRTGLRELAGTITEVRKKTGLLRFLIARMIYQDGVNALIVLGGTFAAGMFGWQIMEIGIFGIILNVVAIGGCMWASRLDFKMGSKAIVVMSIIALLVATIGIISTGPGFTLFGVVVLDLVDSGGLFGTAAEKIYILFGLLIGLSFGPVQASSRSYLAQSIHPDDAGRYFGLYALSGRATSFLAPFMVATVTVWTGSARYGMATLILFFLVGLIILLATPFPAQKVDPDARHYA